MTVEQYYLIIKKLESIYQTYGIGVVIIILILIIGGFVLWKFIIKRTEIIAEEASEKSLKKFQSQVDMELFRHQTKHQKQIDAIHSTYQKLQLITAMINYTLSGEKFEQQIKPQEEIQRLIQYRHDFKHIFLQNRLLFPEKLCYKIDLLIPTVDSFIEIYIGGIRPEPSDEDKEFYEANNNGAYIAGFWGQDDFDLTLKQLKEISIDIEHEFRKIYGTFE